MKKIKVKIRGMTPLLQHRMRDEELFGLLGTKTGKKKDRIEQTPREIAESYAYKNDKGEFVIPTEYLVGAFKEVASEYKQKNSTRRSLKSIAGGIFRPTDRFAPLLHKGKPITTFEVDIQKGTNHQKGAIAICRPRFDEWECVFEIVINTGLLDPTVALSILNDAGLRSGIGSFRVNRGGYFGQFQVTEWGGKRLDTDL